VLKVAVFFGIGNYGPLHLARADALSKVPDIDVHLIELAPTIQTYQKSWETARDKLGFPLTTLVDTPYGQTSLVKLLKRLTEILEELDPDSVAVASYSPLPMLAAARWARTHGAASIIMFPSTESDHQRVWWKERIKRWLVRRYYDAGIVGGKTSRSYLLRLGMPQDRIWERYDVIDNDYFIGRSRDILDKVAGHRKRFALPERYFVSVGRFSEEKNLTRLLQAYRRYRDAEPDGWDLVIVGDGPQREELLGVARSLNLDDVIWPGFVQINELPIYYALSDGFVLPSVSEPWGLVVNEAMACGLPVLVSDRCGSAPDLVVEGKNGYTFDPYSVDAIADRMLRLASLDEARRAAMRRVSSEIIADYSLEAWAENMADCLRQTVARVRSYGEKPS